jgi:hypothetical protein
MTSIFRNGDKLYGIKTYECISSSGESGAAAGKENDYGQIKHSGPSESQE